MGHAHETQCGFVLQAMALEHPDVQLAGLADSPLPALASTTNVPSSAAKEADIAFSAAPVTGEPKERQEFQAAQAQDTVAERLARLGHALSTPCGAAQSQTQYLQQGCFLEAYQLNTPGNQKRLRSVDKFAAVCQDRLYAVLAARQGWELSFTEQPPLAQDCVEVAVLAVACSDCGKACGGAGVQAERAEPSGNKAAEHSASGHAHHANAIGSRKYKFTMRRQASGLLQGCWLTDTVCPADTCSSSAAYTAEGGAGALFQRVNNVPSCCCHHLWLQVLAVTVSRNQ